jgi:hypothetical protein
MDRTDPIKTLNNTATVNNTTVAATTPLPATGIKVYSPATLAHDSTLNGISGFLAAEDIPAINVVKDRTVIQGYPLVQVAGGNPAFHYVYPNSPNFVDVYTDGTLGSHIGSNLGGVGGTIRTWEWNSADNIAHALALNVYGALYLYFDANGGFRWPATKADTGYNTVGNPNYYGGTIPAMKMGALLTLPLSFNITGITDPNARRIAWTLKNFGCYIVDNTGPAGGNGYYAFSVETSAAASWTAAPSTFHSQVLSLIPSLKVVDNNSSASIGGGGILRVPRPVELVDPGVVTPPATQSSLPSTTLLPGTTVLPSA